MDKNIIVFIKERVPLIANLIIATGLVLTISLIFKFSFSFIQVFLILVLMIFMAQLRFMDELKDYVKDLKVNPSRPLPRGLVSKKQVKLLINTNYGLLSCAALILALFVSLESSLFLVITIFWLHLMYHEFFLSRFLKSSPILYALSHQVVIIPVILTIYTTNSLLIELNHKLIGIILLVLSVFFNYEVGRKMDPHAKVEQETYLIHYKKTKTHLLIFTLLLFNLLGAYLIDYFLWVLPAVIFIFITQLRVFANEMKFKDLEGIIALNLIYTMWFIPLAQALSYL